MAVISKRYGFKPVLLMCSALALSACDDFSLGDLNSKINPVPTTDGGQLAPRPKPDSRGVITYPNYQVIVAKRNDPIDAIAARVGMTGQDLARHNGLPADYIARKDEVLALPKGIIIPEAAPDAAGGTSIESIATAAIDRAGPTPVQSGTLQQGPEPIRHVVENGETAYSIARLYNVSVTALASWNGLDRNLSVRPGQQLLIPVSADGTVAQTIPVAETLPGAGSEAPEPPSAKLPLPVKQQDAAIPESPKLSDDRTPVGASRKLLRPVNGDVIRGYSNKKGGNEGLDIAAAAGTSVKAAEGGEVALISKSAGQNTIILLRHPDNLYTVYSNVGDVAVKKGQTVNRGQTIAKISDGKTPFLHFEIRRGTESVDPAPYL
ncbi:peptidoglycan DD-metalloendopeptidase family protein [Amylibacter sp. SFDW26]|uniref:peptidoglycan DD-metalloendopeptidase family protein n=1 Tax=Amylibacter sp. SFDW26 TaxID=2652722 RepID=UPI0012624EA3|nr:peptidoglycan DD-metalloendopeptidase family protein [Amylibacter sp. SFDW26]KAB7616263.1 peptidoglycan DD-metalloendopeptidase family protein [Amylibacter sp. SFDW26]